VRGRAIKRRGSAADMLISAVCSSSRGPNLPTPRLEAEIAERCAAYFAEALEIPATEVERGANLLEFGIDSATLITFIAMLEDFIDTEIDPDIVFYHKTIDALARHLTGRRESKV
jgi:acyl carrier protein